MKVLNKPTRDHSWLQWPVSLKGLPDSSGAHLTLKFFGTALVNRREVAKIMMPSSMIQPPWRADEFSWNTKIWTSPLTQEVFHVLAFVKYPRVLNIYHDYFKLFEDYYRPWIPHITVPKSYFFMVEDGRMRPLDCELKFGELELCLGGPNL